jgi:hypothetical protein
MPGPFSELQLALIGAGALLGVGITVAVNAFRARKIKESTAELSTTSSSHSGNVYETQKAVSEYLMFHFGAPRDILPFEEGPSNALDFAAR